MAAEGLALAKERLSWPNIAARVNPKLIDIGLVRADNCISVERLSPAQLLTSARFDIPAKYIYARCYLLGAATGWARHLYDRHLMAFNDYHEDDGSGKHGINAFIRAFESLIDSIAEEGFQDSVSFVPIDRNHVAIDGGHRIAACLALDQPLMALMIDCDGPRYDHTFFKGRGLPGPASDHIAQTFCELHEDAYIVMVFPAAEGKTDRIRTLLNEAGDVCYEKRLHLKNNGPLNLIREIYRDEQWLGTWEDGFKGAQYKAGECFRGIAPLRIFLLNCGNPDMLPVVKEKIRKLYGIGNHSVHINDTREETVRLARVLFNANSVHFLNHARQVYFPNFYELVDRYKGWLDAKETDGSLFCVDGSSVMALYGIREARDLDFIHFHGDEQVTGIDRIDSHNSELHHHVVSKEELIFDPKNHFFWNNIKFVSLETLKNMKSKRGEKKDLKDVSMINDMCRDSFIIDNLKRLKGIIRRVIRGGRIQL